MCLDASSSTAGQRGLRAQVIPFPPDGERSFWYVTVDNGPPHELFEMCVDDVGDEAFERRVSVRDERDTPEHRGEKPYDPTTDETADSSRSGRFACRGRNGRVLHAGTWRGAVG
jgi:hypothetical protein